MKFWPKKKPLTPEKFWEWFVANEEKILASHAQQAFDMVNPKVQEYNPELSAGIMIQEPGKLSLLEITPNGIREHAESAIRLAQAAPPLPRWDIHAFRMAGPLKYLKISFEGGEEHDLALSQFVGRLGENGIFEMHLFLPCPAHASPRELQHLAYLTLDHALGEEVVMNRIALRGQSHITTAPPTAQPLTELLELMGIENA